MLVTGLVTSAGVYLASPATDPNAIDTIPTADPSYAQPQSTAEGGQGGGITPESAFGASSIRSGTSGQAGEAASGSALNAGSNPMAQQAVQWPLATRDQNITSWFGPRVSPCSGCSSNHRGIDFGGAVGTPIGSISAGVVIDVTPTDQGGLGVHVVVEHRIDGKTTRSVYGHMLAGSLTVEPGDVVLAGEKLGELGNTGASTGPHLHLEIIVEGTHVDPYTFLKRYADDEDVEVIDRPPVDWYDNEDPDAEGEGWVPDEDTLTPDPEQVPDVDTSKPAQTNKPTASGSDPAEEQPAEGQPAEGQPAETPAQTGGAPGATPTGTGGPDAQEGDPSDGAPGATQTPAPEGDADSGSGK